LRCAKDMAQLKSSLSRLRTGVPGKNRQNGIWAQ
jgi:hypothetical protein